MIDTKKYEGHTPGPWRMLDTNDKRFYDIWADREHCVADQVREKDALLIVDAHMLLATLITAEVRIKELAEALTKIQHGSGNVLRFSSSHRCDFLCMVQSCHDIARAALKGKE